MFGSHRNRSDTQGETGKTPSSATSFTDNKKKIYSISLAIPESGQFKPKLLVPKPNTIRNDQRKTTT
jgi:hypothetical protein